jgi:hypothetical protein
MVDMMVDRVLNPNVERFGSSSVNSIVPPKTISISKTLSQKLFNSLQDFGFSLRFSARISKQTTNYSFVFELSS